MKSMQSLLHETSVQAAQEGKTTFTTTTASVVAGQKRSRTDGEAAPQPRPQSSSNASGEIRFQRASTLPLTPSRLYASKIVNHEEAQGTSEWSQRKIIAATPTSTHDPELHLSHAIYGLPPRLVQNFALLGIKQIYPWQKSCLKGPGLLTGKKNLVYCAPTGGGKSLVADGELEFRNNRLSSSY